MNANERPWPPLVLRQKDTGTSEARAVGQAAMLTDTPVISVDVTSLPSHADALANGALPVGSVEFVIEAVHVLGCEEPGPLSYPDCLAPLLRREVRLGTLGDLCSRSFVKAVRTKLFTGFVWDPVGQVSEHDAEQLAILSWLPAGTPVWTAQPVEFLSEWRYYVCSGELLGLGRYDRHGADNAPSPDQDVLAAAIAAFGASADAPVSYAIDLGVLSTGETALVEVNDGFALGLYGRSLRPVDYLRLLTARWRQIAGKQSATSERHT